MKTHVFTVIIALIVVVGATSFVHRASLNAQSRMLDQNESVSRRPPSHTRQPSFTRQPSSTRVPTRRPSMTSIPTHTRKPSFTRIPTHTRIITKTKTKTKTRTRTIQRTTTRTTVKTSTPVNTNTPTMTAEPTMTPSLEPTVTPTPIALQASDSIEFFNEGVSDWKVNVNSVLRGADPTLAMQKGETYTITVTNGFSHPLFLSTDGTTGNEYTSGVSPTGGATTSMTFTVPSDAPSQLFYVCGNHPGMKGIIVITP